MTEQERYIAFAKRYGYIPIVLPESTDDDPKINVVDAEGNTLAIVSMPPHNEDEDLCLCPVELL